MSACSGRVTNRLSRRGDPLTSHSPDDAAPLLAIGELARSFGDVPALRPVSLAARRGGAVVLKLLDCARKGAPGELRRASAGRCGQRLGGSALRPDLPVEVVLDCRRHLAENDGRRR